MTPGRLLRAQFSGKYLRARGCVYPDRAANVSRFRATTGSTAWSRDLFASLQDVRVRVASPASLCSDEQRLRTCILLRKTSLQRVSGPLKCSAGVVVWVTARVVDWKGPWGWLFV